MADRQLTLEEVFSLPEPSIQAVLQSKNYPSQGFWADRISVIIFYSNDDWLTDEDRDLVKTKGFLAAIQLPEAQLVGQFQAKGKAVSAIMTRFDLLRGILAVRSGQLYSFGSGRSGQLGFDQRSNNNIPQLVTIPSGMNIVAVSTGYKFSAVVDDDEDL